MSEVDSASSEWHCHARSLASPPACSFSLRPFELSVRIWSQWVGSVLIDHRPHCGGRVSANAGVCDVLICCGFVCGRVVVSQGYGFHDRCHSFEDFAHNHFQAAFVLESGLGKGRLATQQTWLSSPQLFGSPQNLFLRLPLPQLGLESRPKLLLALG